MRHAALAWLALCLAPGMAAQSSRDELALAQLDAAIGPAPLPAVPRVADPVARQVQEGLEELDRFLNDGDRRAVERALFRFNQASVRRSEWPWPEYAMARTFLVLHDLGAPVIQSEGSLDGELHATAMWRHLLAALQRDPGFMRARVLLAELAHAGGDRELRPHVIDALTIEVSRRDPLPKALVAWGRHQRTRGEASLALAIFARARAAGADPSVVALERARTLVALGDSAAGRAAYWEGADGMTEAGRQLYRQDLGWILDDDSLATFDALAPGREAEWLRRFWGERDAAAVREPGHRVVEHLRRWHHAFTHFRVHQPWKRIWRTRVDFAFDDIRDQCVGSATSFYQELPVVPPALPGDIRHGEALLDHRGVIYLRHGEPFARAVPPTVLADADDAEATEAGIVAGQEGERLAESLRDTEVWVYWVEGSWRVFQFRGSEALGLDGATTMSSYLPWQSVQAWQALARMLPGYQAAANRLAAYRGRLPRTCLPDVTVAISRQREDATVGINSDTERPPVLEPWNTMNRYFALGGEPADPARALITFAIPLAHVVADSLLDGSVAWRLDFRIVAYRLDDGTRIALDTTRAYRATERPDRGIVTGWFEVPLGPGRWQVAVLVRQPGDTAAGGYSLRRNLVFDAAGGLALSDVVTGRSDQPGWPAPDGPFPVNALGAWPEGDVVELWYEVRGIPAGEAYRTTLRVEPAEDRLRDDITVTTRDRAVGEVSRIRRSLGLQALKPGRYRLVVTIEHGARRVTREQEILVTEN